MLKRCLSPLTLVNQVALIVLLSTAIGLAGMAVSGWLVQGVQGSAHAINKAGSLRMQSYRLLAAVPLSEKDKPLIKEMEQTAFSAELTRAAERDGQLAQLQGLQDYWRNELIPALMRAQNRETVSADVSQFVAGLDQLVSGFDRTTEMRIETVVLVHRVMAVFMALLLVFTIIWLRARLLQPWRQLLAMASAVSHRDFTQRANISGRNEMAMLGTALNNMSAELAESYAVLEQRVQEKTAGLEHKNQILSFLWQAAGQEDQRPAGRVHQLLHRAAVAARQHQHHQYHGNPGHISFPIQHGQIILNRIRGDTDQQDAHHRFSGRVENRCCHLNVGIFIIIITGSCSFQTLDHICGNNRLSDIHIICIFFHLEIPIDHQHASIVNIGHLYQLCTDRFSSPAIQRASTAKLIA